MNETLKAAQEDKRKIEEAIKKPTDDFHEEYEVTVESCCYMNINQPLPMVDPMSLFI